MNLGEVMVQWGRSLIRNIETHDYEAFAVSPHLGRVIKFLVFNGHQLPYFTLRCALKGSWVICQCITDRKHGRQERQTPTLMAPTQERGTT